MTVTKNLSLVVVPAPTLTTLTPSSALTGLFPFPLTADGTGFLPGAELLWNGSPRPTTLLSSTQVTATIPGTDIFSAGTAQVQVRNPDGGISNSLVFTIRNAFGSGVNISSISPASGLVGVAVLLTVQGAQNVNFPSNSQIFWNGVAHTTTGGGSSQLTATIAAGDVAPAGPIPVHVVATGPGGGTSNTVNFAASNPFPTLVTATPPSTVAGRPGPLLTMDGTGFVAGVTTLRWNGLALVTSVLSPTQLTAQALDADVRVAGTAQLTVFNPAPGGGLSNALTYPINNGLPQITSISPTTVPFGNPAFTITVNGTDFVDSSPGVSPSTASVVRWNFTTSLVTTFVNGATLTAQVPAALVAVAGSALVDVFNPPPRGGAAGGATFTIDPQIPPLMFTTTSLPVGTIGQAYTGSALVSGGTRPISWTASGATLPPGLTFSFSPFDSASIVGTPLVPFSGRVNFFATDSSTPPMTAFRTLTLTIEGPPQGVSDVVSLTPSNRLGTGNSGTSGMNDVLALTHDGRYVAFRSLANDLINPPTIAGGGFLRDTQARSTQLATVDSAGVPSSGGVNGNIDVTPDGRFVAFDSVASDLVPNDPPGTSDVFVRDTCHGAGAGCAPKTVLVSVDSSGARLPGFGAISPSISADGRHVAFRVVLIPPNSGRIESQIMVHDRDADGDGIYDEQAQAGAISTVTVSVNSSGVAADGDCSSPSINADGRFVAFVVGATNLGVPAGSGMLGYVHDRDLDENGIYDELTAPSGLPGIKTVVVSVDSNGNLPALGGGDTEQVVISADGRVVAFTSRGLLALGTLGRLHIYAVNRDADGNGIFDRGPGETIATRLLSTKPSGQESEGDSRPFGLGISADGGLVSFISQVRDLLFSSDPNFDDDAFVAETCFGAFCTPNAVLIHRVSQTRPLNKANGNTFSADISGDGRRVVFSVSADNMVDVDGDGLPDFNNFVQVYIGDTGLQPGGSTPLLTSLSPTSVTAGRGEFIVNVTGTDQFGAGTFSLNTVVLWNGSPRPTFYAGGRKLLVRIPASDVAAAGTAQITVFDRYSGQTSSAITFTITP